MGWKMLLLIVLLAWLPWANAGPVNINTASAEQLDQELQGIGEALARRIVDYRVHHGPFAQPEDIQKVPYVGVKRFQQNRAWILVKD